MSKSTHFIGQQRYLQIIKFLDRSKIDSLIRKEGYDRYIKKFDSYTHLITLLYAVFSRYDSIREVAVDLLFNANRLHHLGIDYCVKRSTFSFANHKRSSKFFAQVYSMLYAQYALFLLDSRNAKRGLYIMDYTTITLFPNILKGAGRNPIKGKKKGGIKVHTIISSDKMYLNSFVSHQPQKIQMATLFNRRGLEIRKSTKTRQRYSSDGDVV